jgi:VWFA-related protein
VPLRVSLLVALVVISASAAQAPQNPQRPPPQAPRQVPQQPPFKSQVNLVRVDVYATANGTPVQDLTAADFEILEDGKPQKIDSFEHVSIRPALTEPVDPNSTRSALREVADPHRRVFVVYLDIEHVDVGGSHNIREPLIDLMTRVLGPDDLVGIMTPEMSPDQITFGRRTEVIEDGLRNGWAWGRRNTILLDDKEKEYDACFPPIECGEASPSKLAQALIHRRREKMVLDSLQDLVRYMSAVREGRTAVIAVSDGWVLFRPDQSLTVLRKTCDGLQEPVPGQPPPIGVPPGGGGVTTKPNSNSPYGRTQYQCDIDRMALAEMDDERYFRDIMGEANRANVSFYPLDPRGLVVFDSPIGPEQPPPPSQDLANLRSRQESLRTLAVNTDGQAFLDSNNLAAQARRIADDLTSYYLIGYYSTNAKPDGKFRTITVKSRRPGVEIRARRGYRAATAEELAAATKAAAAPAPDSRNAVADALGAVELSARGGRAQNAAGDPRLLHRGPSTGNQLQPASTRVFPRSERLRFELDAGEGESWTAALLDRNGATLPVPVMVGERIDTAAGTRVLTADLTLAPLGAGDYVVQLTKTRGADHQTVLGGFRVTLQ